MERPRAYLGKENIAWLTSKSVLALFGNTVDVARNRYASFVNDGMNEKHRSEFHNGGDDSRVLGEYEFLQQVMVQTENTVPMKISIDTLLTSVAQANESRSISVKFACEKDHNSMSYPGPTRRQPRQNISSFKSRYAVLSVYIGHVFEFLTAALTCFNAVA